MKVLIECLDGKIVSDYCFKGWMGAINEGFGAKLMSLPQVSLQREQLKSEVIMPIGSVGYMEYFFELLGIDKPLPLHCTSSLFDGKYEVVDSKANIEYPNFVKPHLDVKMFTGFVAKSERDFNLYPELMDWDGPYFVRKPFDSDIVSEWRCFVHKGRIVNCSYYNGSKPWMFPNMTWVLAWISQYQSPPIAYTIDAAVLENGKTELVELNDMWAIGPYGINEQDYFLALKDRWFEILNTHQHENI